MKQRRILLLVFIFSILLSSLTFTASAADTSSPLQTTFFNEYDYIEALQESTPQELKDVGLSVQEVNYMATSFKNEILERATLSDEKLKDYGYDTSEIALLRSYANGKELSSEEFHALGATCEGTITRTSVSNKSATFSYKWEWDLKPVIILSDSAAMRWIAYDDNGNEIGVTQTSAYYPIEYHFSYSTSSLAFRLPGTNEPNLDFNTLNIQFPVRESYLHDNGNVSDCYAKRGTIQVSVKVPSGINQNIHHIFVAGLYGHTHIGIGSPSVTVSKGSIGIGFTANTKIDSLGGKKATIYRDSTVVEYWKQ